MKPIVSLLLLCGIVLSGTAQSSAPRYAAEPCPDNLTSAAAPGMSCGRLLVPEDRSAADSPETSLFVVRLPAREDSDKRPIIVLAGGPGDSTSADSAWWLNTMLRDTRDIILIDQRGAGLSRPSLECPEFNVNDDADRLAKCRERLLSAGIDLSAYQAESMAQDIADLIAALKLAPVNVYARSYGARLALLLAQNQPGAVRALALDSAYTGADSALQGAAAKAWHSMQRLFADCRADGACHAAYPQLSTQFSSAAAALASQPLDFAGIVPGASLRLDGASFVVLLRNMLADADSLPYIPALIAAIAENDDVDLPDRAANHPQPHSRAPDNFSEGLYYSALCADEIALTTSARIQAGAAGLPPEFLPLAESALDFLADCGSWLDTDDDISFEPPSIEIPTLYLAGAYDPIAPLPAASSESPLAWRLVFPHLGHGVLDSEACAEAIVAAFLTNPTAAPADDCLQDLGPPEFYVTRNE